MRSLVSPWLLACVALWLLVMVVFATFGTDLFTNVSSGPAPGRPPFVEWDKLLEVGALLATAAVGLLLAVRWLLARRV